MKYVPCDHEVNDTQTYVFLDTVWRLAAFICGSQNATGMVWKMPWVEQGAKLAYRIDHFWRELLYCVRNGEDYEGPIMVFEGHGTSPGKIWKINKYKCKEALKTWLSFRSLGGNPPIVEDEYDRAAKHHTECVGDFFTADEILEGWPKAFPEAVLEVTEPEEDGEFLWTVTTHSRYATKWSRETPKFFQAYHHLQRECRADTEYYTPVCSLLTPNLGGLLADRPLLV